MKKSFLILIFWLFLLSCAKQELKTRSITENSATTKTTQTIQTKKEFHFVDEKGIVLFGGKKIPLKAGAVEITKDVTLQFVTDDNGRWKIEFSSKEYSLVESNPLFEEGNLYPINEESLKELNTLILSKVKN